MWRISMLGLENALLQYWQTLSSVTSNVFVGASSILMLWTVSRWLVFSSSNKKNASHNGHVMGDWFGIVELWSTLFITRFMFCPEFNCASNASSTCKDNDVSDPSPTLTMDPISGFPWACKLSKAWLIKSADIGIETAGRRGFCSTIGGISGGGCCSTIKALSSVTFGWASPIWLFLAPLKRKVWALGNMKYFHRFR